MGTAAKEKNKDIEDKKSNRQGLERCNWIKFDFKIQTEERRKKKEERRKKK
jgi:hypothetical protein